MSAPPGTTNPCDLSAAKIVEGDYPYRYFHFWTLLYEKGALRPRSAVQDERGRCVLMGWDQEQVLGNWWHALVDEMFTEAAQRGAAYRGRASDWVEDAPGMAKSLPVPLRRSGDPCADLDPLCRPTYRGGSDTPLPQLGQEQMELLPSAEVKEAAAVGRWHDKQLWVTHELELEAHRMQYRSIHEHAREKSRVRSLKDRLQKELAQVKEVSAFVAEDRAISELEIPYAFSASETLKQADRVAQLDNAVAAISAELDVCKSKERALDDEWNRIWNLDENGKLDQKGGLRVPPVGSAAILPWLLLHPAHRSPTFRWYMRTVGGPMLSREAEEALKDESGSTKGAFVAVDLRDVAKREPLLKQLAKRAADGDGDGKSDGDGEFVQSPERARKRGGADAGPAAGPSIEQIVYGKRPRTTESEDAATMDPATWDAPHLRALWRATALLHDVGVKMAHIATFAPAADDVSTSAESFPFFVRPGPDTADASSDAEPPRYRLGPSAETDQPDPKKHELLRYISGCPMQDLEFADTWKRVNSTQESWLFAVGRPAPPDDDEEDGEGGGEARGPLPRMPVTVLTGKGVYSQIGTAELGWHRIRARDDNSSSCNWADALRCEVARLAERLVVEARESTSQTATLLMTALGVSDQADIDRLLPALKSDVASGAWAAAFGILSTFFSRGVVEAMRATSGSTAWYASSDAVGQPGGRLDANPSDDSTEKLEEMTVLWATGLSNMGEWVFEGIERSEDQLTKVQDNLRKSQVMHDFDDTAMREFETMKRACLVLAARTEIGKSGATNEHPPFLAVSARKHGVPQSVFDQQEELMLEQVLGYRAGDSAQLGHFPVGFQRGSQGRVIPLAERANTLAETVFGTLIRNTGMARKWRATLAKRRKREDGVQIFDDHTRDGQTGPPAFHFLDNEHEHVDEAQVRAAYLQKMQEYDEAAFAVWTEDEKTAMAADFVERAMWLRNSFGDINMFPDLDASQSRWPPLNFSAYRSIDEAIMNYCRMLEDKRRFASTLQKAREAWALERTTRAVSTMEPDGYCLGLFAVPPPSTYPLDGGDVKLWVSG